MHNRSQDMKHDSIMHQIYGRQNITKYDLIKTQSITKYGLVKLQEYHNQIW